MQGFWCLSVTFLHFLETLFGATYCADNGRPRVSTRLMRVSRTLIMGLKQGVDQDLFRQIFRDHWPEFKEARPLYDTPHYDEVIENMLGCGGEEGGFSEWRCGNCGGDVRRIAFSCKRSLCPSCSKVYMDNFVCQVSRSLRDGLVYVHVTLTVPKRAMRYS